MTYAWGPICERIDTVVHGMPTTWIENGKPLKWPVYLDYDKEYQPIPHYHENLKLLQEVVIPELEEMGWDIYTAEIETLFGEHGFRVNVLTPDGNSTSAFHESLASAITVALYLAL